MTDLFSKKHNRRTRFTRMCIGEAVCALMDRKAYSEIRVSDIAKKAGVSRMTFYHYYQTGEEALADYFYEIVKGFIRECIEKKESVGEFQGRKSILHALQYFDRYADFILKLVDAKMYSTIIDCMNEYMTRRILPHTDASVYELYYYGAALLNVFIKWEAGGKKETAEEIAEIIQRSHAGISGSGSGITG